MGVPPCRDDPRRTGQKTAGKSIKSHTRMIKSPTTLNDLLECSAGPCEQVMPPMDDLDHRLLALLRGDARASIASLAKKLGVARGTVQNRMARLEADGTIAGYTVRLKPDIQEQQIRALMTIAVEGNQVDAVVKALRGEPAVASLHSTNGRWDVVAELRTDTLATFDRVLARISRMPGVLNSETSLLLTTFKL